MNKKAKILTPLIWASIVTIFRILFAKIGGHASGGIYSEPHTWKELLEKTPEFLIYFSIIFLAFFTYELLKKNKENAICPKCENCYQTSEIESSTCPKCGARGEKLKGFYQRHPEFAKK